MPCGGCGKAAKKVKNIATGFYNVAMGIDYAFTPTRVRTCQKCEKNYWIKSKLFCSICKCFIPAKARVEDEKCPLDKWSK